MAEVKKITIFKLDSADASATVSNDKIEFNSVDQSDADNYKKAKFEGAYISSIQKIDPEGIGNNVTAEKPDGNIQPQGVVNVMYMIKGWITKIDGNSGNGTNAFLAKLQSWKDGEQDIIDDWESGAFGIEDLNDSTNTLLPIKTTVGGGPALIFAAFDKTDDYRRNRADFVLTFRRSRGLTV